MLLHRNCQNPLQIFPGSQYSFVFHFFIKIQIIPQRKKDLLINSTKKLLKKEVLKVRIIPKTHHPGSQDPAVEVAFPIAF